MIEQMPTFLVTRGGNSVFVQMQNICSNLCFTPVFLRAAHHICCCVRVWEKNSDLITAPIATHPSVMARVKRFEVLSVCRHAAHIWMLYGPILLEAAAVRGEKVMRNAGVQEEGGFHGGNEEESLLSVGIKVTSLAAPDSSTDERTSRTRTHTHTHTHTHTQINKFYFCAY